MEIEHAALAGIASASNDVERDDFRSPVAGMPGVGAVGVAPFPQAIATAATRMTEYPRIAARLRSVLDPLEDRT
jgi:hypothetical protein